MAPIKSKTKRKSNIGAKTVQTNVKNQRRKNASSDSEEDSTDSEVEKITESYVVKKTVNDSHKMSITLYRQGGTENLQQTVADYFSSDEDIFESKPKIQDNEHLSNSMKNLDISNKASVSRKSHKDLKVTPSKASDNPAVAKIKSETLTHSRTRSASRASNRESCKTPSGRNLRNNEPKNYAEYESPTRKTKETLTRTRSVSRASNKESCQTPSGRNLRNRNEPISYTEYQSPTRNTPVSKKENKTKETDENICETPTKREKILRDRGKLNYIEDEDEVPLRSRSNKRSEIQEPNENESCASPRKRRASVRNPLNSVVENDQSWEPMEEDSPKSQKRSTRGRKSIAKVDADYVYEGTPSKRKSAAKSVPGWQKISSESRNSTPARRKLSTVENDIGTPKTPKTRALTPRTMTVTPKTRAYTPRTRILASRTSVLTPRTSALTPRTSALTPRTSALTPRTSALTPRSSVLTPKGRRTLTPSMHMRSVNVAKPKSNLQEFRTRLHVSFVPKSLPCREEEFNNIFTFLRGKLTEEIGGCIYISGVPGTGKTATVNEVVSCLKKLELQGELPPFEFVDINGMKLTEPRQAYVQIKKKLSGITSSWEESHRYLHERFTIPACRRNMTLLLIDEMDLLCTKRQDVVYNLLDWPTHRASHLVVITIANTMDLPERILMSRVTSRLGLTRLTFSPYNHVQLMEIVKTRLKDTEGFRPEAIQLVARKVAAVTGDARRALDICRRATEIAESKGKEFVTIPDVTSALDEMIANPRVQAIKCCSLMEQKFLEAVCQEVTRIGTEQVTLKNIYTQFEKLCLLEGEKPLNITQTLEICRKLASWRLVLWESGADFYQSVLLNVSADDIYFSRQKVD